MLEKIAILFFVSYSLNKVLISGYTKTGRDTFAYEIYKVHLLKIINQICS